MIGVNYLTQPKSPLPGAFLYNIRRIRPLALFAIIFPLPPTSNNPSPRPANAKSLSHHPDCSSKPGRC